MPESLLNTGLEPALYDLCHSLTNENLQIDCQALSLSRDLSKEVQVTAYRMVQELLANAIKHSGASRILVQCTQYDDMLFITVEDNGKGFNTEEASTGLGLDNLKNRIRFHHGNMEVNSAPGKGTIVNIEFKTHAA